jgi:hypothetical protein
METLLELETAGYVRNKFEFHPERTVPTLNLQHDSGQAASRHRGGMTDD